MMGSGPRSIAGAEGEGLANVVVGLYLEGFVVGELLVYL